MDYIGISFQVQLKNDCDKIQLELVILGFLEGWQSGQMQRLAKPCSLTRAVGSNPAPSARERAISPKDWWAFPCGAG